MLNRIAVCAAHFVAAAVIAGCSKGEPERIPVYPVSGQITLNGRPAAGATIVFHPQVRGEAPAPRGVADSAGNYRITTFNTGDGAPLGAYVVTVALRPMVQKDGEFVAGPSLVPPKYGQVKTSDLKINVIEGQNTVPLKIVR